MGRTNKKSVTNKADLARAGTMELTSKEGRAFLEKNLTEWKKPLLIDQETAVNADDSNDDADVDQPPTKKAKLSKATTMDATAKEGKALLGDKKLGDTRQVTKAAQKKSAVKRAGTMQQAVAEAAAVYGDLTDCGSRKTTDVAVSPKKTKAAPKKEVKKAKTASKSATKKAAKKGSMKKFGTMCNTAKEAKELLGGEELGDTRQVTKAKQATK